MSGMVEVGTSLLSTLSASPLWSWDSQPSLWAIVGTDPMIVTPILVVEDVATLNVVARSWREQIGGEAVPVDGLIVIVESSIEGAHKRDLVIVEKDGTTTHLRFDRASAETEVVDSFMQECPVLAAAREVGAAAWA